MLTQGSPAQQYRAAGRGEPSFDKSFASSASPRGDVWYLKCPYTTCQASSMTISQQNLGLSHHPCPAGMALEMFQEISLNCLLFFCSADPNKGLFVASFTKQCKISVVPCNRIKLTPSRSRDLAPYTTQEHFCWCWAGRMRCWTLRAPRLPYTLQKHVALHTCVHMSVWLHMPVNLHPTFTSNPQALLTRGVAAPQ